MPCTALTCHTGAPELISPPGVYRPQADTLLLADTLAREPLGPVSEVMEVGTGTGALALQAAARGAQVTAVDVSWAAVLAARLNGLRQRLSLRVLHGDFAARTLGSDSTWSSPSRPTSHRPTPGCPLADRSGHGTAEPTGGASSTGSARPPRPCCLPAGSSSWCTPGCAKRRPRCGSWHCWGCPQGARRGHGCPGGPYCAREAPGCENGVRWTRATNSRNW